jgi:hypothetical protein
VLSKKESFSNILNLFKTKNKTFLDLDDGDEFLQLPLDSAFVKVFGEDEYTKNGSLVSAILTSLNVSYAMKENSIHFSPLQNAFFKKTARDISHV